MKLKSIIRLSAELLGLDDVCSVLDGKTETDDCTQQVIDRLVGVSNIVTGELSSAYLPLERTEEFKVVNDKISFSAFLNRAVRILEVFDKDDNPLEFSFDRINISVSGVTVAKVRYNYVAEDYRLTDDIGYTERNISKTVLAYGVCAEFCLTERRFDEAVMWHERFEEGVKARILPKSGKISARRWE